MMQKLLISVGVVGCIFLCKDPAFARLNHKSLGSTSAMQHLTQEEQKRLPFLIALSFKELCPEKNQLASFVEGLKIADSEKVSDYQESPEMQAYAQYAMQIALDPKITKNLSVSTDYLQSKQNTENTVTLICNKICYKILKNGKEPGITDNTINKVKINFTIKDIENNFLAGNYALLGSFSCMLSELIPGMAYGMLGMRLNEVREIYVHPEYAYGVFSNFGNGRALAIRVELIECTATDATFVPSLIPVDFAKLLHNPSQGADIQDLFICYGKASWSFYKQNLPQVQLNDVLPYLQSDTALSPEDREILHKLQWLIYFL